MISQVARAITRTTYHAALGLTLLLAGCGGAKNATAPVISAGTTVNVAENTTSVMTVTARDADGDALSFSLTGSVDDALFAINPGTGALSFISAPDYEAPGDTGGDNTYDIEITASDGVHVATQAIAVSVTDVLELNTSSGGVKTLRFSWSAFEGATYYKLMVNPDGASGFVQEGADITGTRLDVVIPVHLTDWINASYLLEAYDDAGNLLTSSSESTVTSLMLSSIGYFKASNAGASDHFGWSVALSDDGNTLAVGALQEDSSTTGVNSTPDEAVADSGAVYLFRYDANLGTWAEEAYLKASNTAGLDLFGSSVALSRDGNTLAVGAPGEDSSTGGVNSVPDTNLPSSGAVYLFRYDTTAGWAQEAYIKSSQPGMGDFFGESVALNNDGSTLAVGASPEDSSTTGVNSTPDDNVTNSGAVYLFRYDSVAGWAQEAYIKASNPGSSDHFGFSIALSRDGNTLAAGAYGEDSSTTGVNSTPDTNAMNSGAVYLFRYDAIAGWAQEAYIKASNAQGKDQFGRSVTLSGDGNILGVGASWESSSTSGVNSIPDENAPSSGAVYLFRYDTNLGSWAEEAYIKASNTGENDWFGSSVALSGDGSTLAVGAIGENSNTTGVNSTPNDYFIGTGGSGAVYLFRYDANLGTWTEDAYVKASNTYWPLASFGHAVALSVHGETLIVGAPYEESSNENYTTNTGAMYLY